MARCATKKKSAKGERSRGKCCTRSTSVLENVAQTCVPAAIVLTYVFY